jgi:16S rRNA (adenine1518-N6/adenine1519-N6)-dimethyltransferase
MRHSSSSPLSSSKKHAASTPAISVADQALRQRAKRALASRRFSQNYLVKQSVLDGIVRCLELNAATDRVLEIGPGLGFLTECLWKTGTPVMAVEIDNRLVEGLRRNYETFSALTSATTSPDRLPESSGFQLIHRDFLKTTTTDFPWLPTKVVGNLPYNITSPILFKLLGEVDGDPLFPTGTLQQVTVMVQREVADRMAAKVGTKAYNPLSLALQSRFEVEPEFYVPPEAFYPAPKVTSSVVSLFPKAKPAVAPEQASLFLKVVRAAFQQRRKTLWNALRHSLAPMPAEVIEAALNKAGLNPQHRAEQVPLEGFVALTEALDALTR